MFDEYPDVLKPEEIMAILDIGKNTVYRLLKTGAIKSFRIGHIHKIPKLSLIKYIESKANEA